MAIKILSILLIIILSSFQDDLTTKEIKGKAARIRTKLISGEQLPPSIEKVNIYNPNPGSYGYFYGKTRKENNVIIDSINISIDIMDGVYLSFNEAHFKKGKEYESYVYILNKDGIIVWAYRTEGGGGVNIEHIDDGSTIATPLNQPILEINTDTTNITEGIPIKIPDEKTREMYNARLKVTLDELDKFLFK